MSWARQVGHVLRKDLRRGRVGLAAVVGVAVLFGGLVLAGPLPGDLIVVLLPASAILAAFFAVAILVQDDPPLGRRARWRALPIRGSAVLGAKVAVVLALAGVLAFAMTLPWLIVHGLEGATLAWGLVARGVPTLGFLAVAAALAAVTPNLKGFVLGAIFTLVALSMIPFPEAAPARASAPFQTDSIPQDLHPGGLVARAFLSPPSPTRSLMVHLELVGAAPGFAYVLTPEALEVRAPSGERHDFTVDGSARWLQRPAPPGAAGLRWLGESRDDLQVAAVQASPPGAPGRVAMEAGAEVVLRATLEMMRPESLVQLRPWAPLVLAGGRRFDLRDVRVEAGQPHTRVRISDVRSRPGGDRFEGPFMPRGSSPPAAGDLAFVLVNPTAGEAYTLEARGGGGTLGPFPILHPAPLRTVDLWTGHRLSGMGAAPLPEPLEGPLDEAWLEASELRVYEWTSLWRTRIEVGPFPVTGRDADEAAPLPPQEIRLLP